MCWIIEKAREFLKNVYLCSIYYTKAFDSVDHNKLWKTLKEMGIPEYLTCLLRNLHLGQEAKVRILYGTTNWFKIEKEVWQGCLLSSCLSNLHIEHIIRNCRAGWFISWNQDCLEKYQQPQICRWFYLNGRKERGTKASLDEGERGEWKSRLKTQCLKKKKDHGIESHHFLAKYKVKR